ncbi:hypothetical protein [Demequina salsinemoris]|uniref:hypothetical protein n=1 Tax=Demequina salsinemoris TaxID=577470 RepID=UPI00078561B9|nr:hypothetical protein [Demequina salsinemoris]
MDNTVEIDVRGARGRVEVEGRHGVTARVLLDGAPVQPKKGVFAIPVTGGRSAEVRLRGLLPGFQNVVVDGERVLGLGDHVPPAARVTMFAPLLLVFTALLGTVAGTVGLILALLLFFMSIMVVKNPDMPVWMRTGLPLANTVAGAVVVLVFTGVLG